MTLEEMLALLPDNDVGAIDAADLRVIVTELFTIADTARTTAEAASGVANDAYGQISAISTTADAAHTAATAAENSAAAAQTQVSALTPRVTALEAKQEYIGQMFTYEWSTAATPAVGKMTSNPQWNIAATKLLISETTADGASIFFTQVDAAPGVRINLAASNGGKITATTTGPSVDMGTYREVPVAISLVNGPAPVSNERVTVTVLLAVTP
jgi:hypothetical protein